MYFALVAIILGVAQTVFSDHTCSRPRTTACNLEGVDDCTERMPSRTPRNSMTSFAICLLKKNSIDRLIDCTGQNDERLCMSAKPIDNPALKLFVDPDGNNCWCRPPRDLLYLAALDRGCLLENVFAKCPQDDVYDFRNCLCNRNLVTENLNCLRKALDLKSEPHDFSKQCPAPTMDDDEDNWKPEEGESWDFFSEPDPKWKERRNAESAKRSILSSLISRSDGPSLALAAASQPHDVPSASTGKSFRASRHKGEHGLMMGLLMFICFLVTIF